jgi:hypothetical protein
MRTNPLNEAWAFLTGTSSFHQEAGAQGILMVPLFYILLIASIWIARKNWLEDPSQRTTEHLVTWFFRVMIGIMWFEGSIWKLPLPISEGFSFWVGEMGKHAAFGWHQWLAINVYKPLLILINPMVFLTEVSLAVSYMLGFGVRLFGIVGMLFAFHLYLGLYRHPNEWPWLFFFLIFVQGFFVMHAAGRSLGLDALLRKTKDGLFAAGSSIGDIYRRAS